MDDQLQTIRDRYKNYCHRLGVETKLRITAQHDGYAHVEYRDGLYHHVVTERGTEYRRRSSSSEDDILYWLMSDVVHDLASTYEREHRVAGQSFRRALFARTVKLMGSLEPAWADRKSAELGEVLERRPYDDAVEGQ
jgi:hypothetical protein